MRLLINGIAACRSSLGVRRYFTAVMEHLDWPEGSGVYMPPAVPIIERCCELLTRGGEDSIFWSPSHRGSLRAKRQVVTVHDCINIEYTYRKDPRLPLLRKTLNAILNFSEVVISISHATKAAVLRNFDVDERKIKVIQSPSLFPDQFHTGKICDPAEGTDGRQNPFILMVTNSLPHKNAIGGCRAYARSAANRRGIELRVIGQLPSAAVAECKAAGVRLNICGSVDDVSLDKHYKESLFLFSPSLEEGHNLVIGEALSRGVNVLCSNIAVHREFYKGMVAYCEPLSLDSMTSALNEAILDPEEFFPDIEDLCFYRGFEGVAADYREVFSNIGGI